ncbi:MAG TPA: Calx-beta domain-containing protein, partial [Pyrinomonadaceae bacterium]|nr:Calx-beta domain-containing protein [Pyrinomonadaceae bacterium]
LTNPSAQTITVDYTTADVTATAGSDYVAAAPGTLTFPPGTTSATINVVINGDTTVEPEEKFDISLSNPVNVNIFSGFSTVVIDNDDAGVRVNTDAIFVNEGAGFINVTIVRFGDSSKAVSVKLTTSDTAGLQNCTLANGKASERCDYGTTVGTAQFPSGEAFATFTIPIVDDALVEGDETFTVNLTGPNGATLGTPNAATITIFDNDTTPATQNPIDGVTPFITQQYIDFLGRLPDSIGLKNWTETLSNCPNGGFGEFDNPTCDRVHVSAGFFLSEEFRGRGYFAYKFYEVGLDRRPTYAEFVPDMAQVGGAQSPQQEVLSKAAYTDAFAQRQEFKNRYDAMSNSEYVNALETNAEVILTNKTALIDALNSSQKTRAQVLREIVELQAVTDKFFIRAFVAMQYFGYLRRDPDTIGYDNWVTTLTADPSNFRHMIFGFIFSNEYRQRFGP